MTWMDDIAQYLEDSTASIGVFSPSSTQTRSIFIQNMPSTGDSFIVLYPYAGLRPVWNMDKDAFRSPRLNVLVVSTAADGGHAKSIDIRTRLDHAYDLKLPTSSPLRHYLTIECSGEPEYLGKDANGRGHYGTNYQVNYIDCT